MMCTFGEWALGPRLHHFSIPIIKRSQSKTFQLQDSELSDQMVLRSAARVGAWVLWGGAHAGVVVLADPPR